MEIEKANKAFYNRLYRRNNILSLFRPFISFDQQSKSKRNFSIVKSFLKSATKKGNSFPRVLDYGFGHGTFLLKIPRFCEIYGCDLSEEAINSLDHLSKLLGRRMNLLTPDQFQSKTYDYKFDLIVCSHVLEHVPNDNELIQLFCDNLSNHGKILLNLPINEVWRDPKHERDYTPESIQKLLETYGFKIESMRIYDRWTAFILNHEKVRTTAKPILIGLKALRLLLALLPLAFVDAFECLLSRKYKEQQILVLACHR